MASPQEVHTWRQLAGHLGEMPNGDVQVTCNGEGLVDAVARVGTDEEREAAYARLAHRVGQLQGSAGPTDAEAESVPAVMRKPDPRWQLLADLSARADWPLFQPTVFLPLMRGGGAYSLPRSNAVEVRFDDRFTLDAAVSVIRATWPELIRMGIVRSRPRRMKDNTVRLLRFVCLETNLEDSWEARWRAWEARHGRRGKGWSYPTRRAFITDVHRAEQSLVGQSRGLAWFYEPLAREEWSELLRRAGRGDKEAEKELRRREDMGVASLKDVFARADKAADPDRRNK